MLDVECWIPYINIPFVLSCRYVVLVSGLGFGEKNQDCLQLQMFIDLVTGQLGSVQVTSLRFKLSKI